ncbi:MAG TPA: hypothetical protein VFS43_16925 [Polyangiaceae bacterium]|nr:hypothetical protein [Polyangiaceae bacterium]
MNQRERIEALLAERVTEGLSPAHEAELERLLGGPVDASPEAARWEAAAAAVAVASVSADKGGLPPALARALLDDAELFVAAAKREERKRARVMTTGAASAAELGPDEGARPAPAAGGWLSSRWGWVAAAAACALFAAQTLRLEAARGAAGGGASASSTLHVTCSVEGGGGEPAGELLWNARERQGVLVFDRSPGAAPSASGHVVYRCAPVAP